MLRLLRAGRTALAWRQPPSGWITQAAGADGVSPFDIQQVPGHV